MEYFSKNYRFFFHILIGNDEGKQMGKGGGSMNKNVTMMAIALLIWSIAAFADAAASKIDAENMVRKAAAFVTANGREKALVEFSSPKRSFVKGELYIYAVDFKGTVLAHGKNSKLVGKNMLDLKDATGKLFVQEIVKAGKQGSGWVEYRWTNPVSRKIEPKIAYVQSADNIILICGIYKSQ